MCSYMMALNLSNQQIAAELDLNKGEAQATTAALHEGVEKNPVILGWTVEADEVYIVAGHKG